MLGAAILGVADILYASVASAELLEPAIAQVTEVLRARHRIQADEEADFTVRNLNDMAEASRSASRVMTNLLFSVASISLLVGGIGIMNILLVSVTERTREIGIRKALGAKPRRILGQFALEAVTLSLFGGVLGLVLGLSLTALGRWAFGFPMTVPPWAIALALGMSSGVGLVFGIYPAARAARLDPVEAMRSE